MERVLCHLHGVRRGQQTTCNYSSWLVIRSFSQAKNRSKIAGSEGQCNSTESVQANHHDPNTARRQNGPHLRTPGPATEAHGPTLTSNREEQLKTQLSPSPSSFTPPPLPHLASSSQANGASPDRPSPRPSKHENGDMAVIRSPHSILKVGGKSRKLAGLTHAPNSSLSSGQVGRPPDLNDSPLGPEASDSGQGHKVRLVVPEAEDKPPSSKSPAHVKHAPAPEPAGNTPITTDGHGVFWVFKETEDINNLFTFGEVLGRGQFGTTRLVTEISTEKPFACKSINKKRLKKTEEVEDVKREVQILHHLDGHPNVIGIKEVYEDRRHVHILMELACGGELFERVSKRGRYSEKDAAAVFRTMVAVIVHCHNMGVIHRDLKPENFLLMSNDQTAQLKATDFGLSVFFTEGQSFSEIVGSALYIAPEVLKRDYGKEADIWSLGVILYILLSGSPPFLAETEEKVFRKVLRAAVDMRSKPWPLISEEAKDCVRSMLQRDPKERATAQQILNHPWVRADGVASDEPLQSEVLGRLKAFSAMNKLKKEAVKIIASLIPEDEIIGLREIFKSIDSDNSGAISIAELREGLLKKGTTIPDDQLRQLVEYADANGNGNLDYDEFIAATLNQSKIEREGYMLLAFQKFDLDGSGYITREELFEVLKQQQVPTMEIDSILKEVDHNGDGQIDYEEFCYMMRKVDHMDQLLQPDGQVSNAGSEVSKHSVQLVRQSSDFVRPSWAVNGGSRGEHMFQVTPELDVKVQRTSLMRAMSRNKKRNSAGYEEAGSTRSLKLIEETVVLEGPGLPPRPR